MGGTVDLKGKLDEYKEELSKVNIELEKITILKYKILGAIESTQILIAEDKESKKEKK